MYIYTHMYDRLACTTPGSFLPSLGRLLKSHWIKRTRASSLSSSAFCHMTVDTLACATSFLVSGSCFLKKTVIIESKSEKKNTILLDLKLSWYQVFPD